MPPPPDAAAAAAAAASDAAASCQCRRRPHQVDDGDDVSQVCLFVCLRVRHTEIESHLSTALGKKPKDKLS